jgi:hypothetical protein
MQAPPPSPFSSDQGSLPWGSSRRGRGRAWPPTPPPLRTRVPGIGLHLPAASAPAADRTTAGARAGDCHPLAQETGLEVPDVRRQPADVINSVQRWGIDRVPRRWIVLLGVSGDGGERERPRKNARGGTRSCPRAWCYGGAATRHAHRSPLMAPPQVGRLRRRRAGGMTLRGDTPRLRTRPGTADCGLRTARAGHAPGVVADGGCRGRRRARQNRHAASACGLVLAARVLMP